MNDNAAVRKQIITSFKLSGFVLRSESILYLVQILLPLATEKRKEWLDEICDHIQNQGLASVNIEKEHLEMAIQECNRSGLDDTETIFSVINAFDIPKFKYNKERRKYFLENNVRRILPAAFNKSEFMRDRYIILWQRTMRHELFSPNVLGSTSTVKKFQLRQIESLLAQSHCDEVVVLGLLTQLTENKFHLEDLNGSVPLDLRATQYHSGLFCDGSFVLVEGQYVDGMIKVAGLGFPPPESAVSSRAFFGNLNTWGGTSKSLLKYSEKLRNTERLNSEATIVFLSDCWLDNVHVMDKLSILINGYNDCPPTAIVLMGPFIRSSENPFILKQRLKALAELFTHCDQLKKETDIILVPSLDDPMSASILPRPPLPECLCDEFKRLVPRAILATNPCRIQYCTQQIVVCRCDLVTKLCRNTIHFPTDGQLADHFARTLICQGTLAPLSPIALPTYWDYDAALLLYPLPDLIVIGDASHGFHTTQQGCTVLNTGSFPKSKFSFKMYIPSNRMVEDSQIPDDNTEPD